MSKDDGYTNPRIIFIPIGAIILTIALCCRWCFGWRRRREQNVVNVVHLPVAVQPGAPPVHPEASPVQPEGAPPVYQGGSPMYPGGPPVQPGGPSVYQGAHSVHPGAPPPMHSAGFAQLPEAPPPYTEHEAKEGPPASAGNSVPPSSTPSSLAWLLKKGQRKSQEGFGFKRLQEN